MSINLRVLAGPPRSGKTDQLVGFYAERLRETLSEQKMPRVLWLSPHRLAVEEVRGRFIARGIAGCLAPGIKTIARFGEAMVAENLSSPTILSRSASRWLVGEAIREASKAKQLDLLAEVAGRQGLVAGRQGLVDAIEQMIGQWKARGITAGQFEKYARGKGRSRRDRELAAIYARYQEQLARREAADRFDVDRLAVETLHSHPTSPAERWELVVVNGFTSFSRYEQEMLSALAARADEMWVSLGISMDRSDRTPSPRTPLQERGPGRGGLPIGEGDAKVNTTTDLTVAARRVLESLQARHPGLEMVQVESEGKESSVASLAWLRANLFASAATEPSSEALDSADRIAVVVGSDAQDELIQVARRIKKMLTSGGVAPRDIVVAVPAIRAHQHRLREVFESFGVPVSMATPRLVGEAAELQALTSVLALAFEDWPYRQVLEVVGNGLLKVLDGPSSLAARWPAARGATEWIVRDLQIARKQKTLHDTLTRLAAARSDAEASNPRQQAAAISLSIIERIANATGELPATATPLQWVASCEQLAQALGLDLQPQFASAWQQAREAAAAIERESGEKEEPLAWKLAEWLAQIRDWSGWLPISTSLDEEGCVRVLSAEAARHVAARHLFVVGLSEQSFSSAGSASGLYTEDQYDSLAATTLAASAVGPESAPPAARPYQRSMQLFHDLVCRATESLTFSFAALDGKGQRTPPSPLLEEACRAFGSPLIDAVNAAPNITPLPPKSDAPRSSKDWRLRAVADVLDNKPDRLGSLLAGEATRGTASAIAAALATSHHRATGDSFGTYEGIIPGPSAQKWLAQNFGPEHLWSTSQLEGYANCPYQFLLKQVLRLEPLGDLALETDYRRRGTLAHRALVELHERLDRLTGNKLAPSEVDLPDFVAHFEAAVGAVLKGFASFGIEGVLNELLAVEIRQWAGDYHEQHTKYDAESHDWDSPLVPTYFEIRFGNLRRQPDDEPEDSASSDQPLVIDLGDERMLVGGRIDRIDVGKVEGQPVLQVIDYKTSKTFTVKDDEIREGRKLQPALYAMAAAQIVATTGDVPALPLRSGYWVLRASGFTDKTSRALHEVVEGTVQAAAGWKELEKAMIERLREMVAGVRKGDFPMHNVDDKCTSRCDFKHVCRVHQVRSLGKTWPAPAAEAASPPCDSPGEGSHE